MVGKLKQLFKRTFPGVAFQIYRHRCRQVFERFAPFQATVKAKLYPAGSPVKVLSGPFAGMLYVDEVVWGCITPKWLGTYELELHPVVAEIARQGYQTIIDVGSAEGYYAVGMARLLPHAMVKAFDTERLGRMQLGRLSALNGTTARIAIGERFVPTASPDPSGGNTLLISDIEGFEQPLLDPLRHPVLLCYDLLVEVHGFAGFSAAEVLAQLRNRFTGSHQIREIRERRRSVDDCPPIAALPLGRDVALQAMDEGRTEPQSWLWMRRNSTAA